MESSPERHAVCVACGNHCGCALSSQRGWWCGAGQGGGGSGLGGLCALLLEHVEQGRTPFHRLCTSAPTMLCGGGGSAS